MNVGLATVAAVLAAAGALCLYFRNKYLGEIGLLATMTTSRAADVASVAPGTLIEVKGTLRCDAPLTGQFSGQPCAYYRSEIEREEVQWKDGRSERRFVPESSVENSVPFQVEDDSGRVTVDSKNASIEAKEVYNQFGNSSVIGDLVSLASNLAGGATVNYRYREHILALGLPIYVVGTVLPGGLIGAAPKEAAIREFLVTFQSKDEYTASTRTTTTILLWLAAALCLGALGMLVWSFRYTKAG